MKHVDRQKPATKDDLDELGAQIIGAISKELENYATKEDLKQVEQRLSNKIDKLSYDVSGLRNRVIDVEMKQGAPHVHSA